MDENQQQSKKINEKLSEIQKSPSPRNTPWSSRASKPFSKHNSLTTKCDGIWRPLCFRKSSDPNDNYENLEKNINKNKMKIHEHR